MLFAHIITTDSSTDRYYTAGGIYGISSMNGQMYNFENGSASLTDVGMPFYYMHEGVTVYGNYNADGSWNTTRVELPSWWGTYPDTWGNSSWSNTNVGSWNANWTDNGLGGGGGIGVGGSGHGGNAVGNSIDQNASSSRIIQQKLDFANSTINGFTTLWGNAAQLSGYGQVAKRLNQAGYISTMTTYGIAVWNGEAQLSHHIDAGISTIIFGLTLFPYTAPAGIISGRIYGGFGLVCGESFDSWLNSL